MIRILIAALLFLGVTLAVWAGPKDGFDAYQRGDYVTAFRELTPVAEQGNFAAQFTLGIMWLRGDGVPQQDNAEAAKWFRKAAEQGYPDAQMTLGVMYYFGQGVPQDYAEAMRWIRPLAERGNADAQNKLGAAYMAGQGVPQNNVIAYMWFNLASAQLTGKDRERVVENRDRLASLLTPAQLAEGQRLAREWRPGQPITSATSASSVTNVFDQMYSQPATNTTPSAPSPARPSAFGGIKINPALFLDLAIQWSFSVLVIFVIVYKIAKRSTNVQFTKTTGILGFVIAWFLSTFSVYVFGLRFYEANPGARLLTSTIVSAVVIATFHGLRKNSGKGAETNP